MRPSTTISTPSDAKVAAMCDNGADGVHLGPLLREWKASIV